MIPLTPEPPKIHAAETSQLLNFRALGKDLAVSRQSARGVRSAEQRRLSTWIQQFSRERLHAAIRCALHHKINASARYGPDAHSEITSPIVDGVGRP